MGQGASGIIRGNDGWLTVAVDLDGRTEIDGLFAAGGLSAPGLAALLPPRTQDEAHGVSKRRAASAD